MTANPQDPEEEAFEAACRWLLRLKDHPDVQEVREGLERWLAERPEHRRVLEEAERVLGQVEAAARAVDLSRRPADLSPIPLSLTRRGGGERERLRWAALAAGLAGLVVASLWWSSGGLDRWRSDVATRTGETGTLALPDGTRVELNTDTAVAYASADRRHMRLLRGEAYFTVRHDVAHPFVVDVPGGEIRDVGTRFDVRVFADRSWVEVEEGEVATRGAVTRVSETNASAWRHRQLVFYRTPLAGVIADLNRYREGHIFVVGQALEAMPVTGVFATAKPDEAVGIIERTLHVRVARVTSYAVVLY